MLRFTDDKSRVSAGDLSPEEDSKLRRAFGCNAEARYKAEGRAVVRAHQEKGRWFLCDCRPDQKRAPTLFPTIDGHIQREPLGKGIPHDGNCVFARDDEQQKKLVVTYRQRQPDDLQFRLLRNFGDGAKKPASSSPVIVRQYDNRPALATVLAELLHKAMLDRILAEEPLRGGLERRKDENKHLMEAAQNFTLDRGQPVSDWLVTDIKDLPDLRGRILAKNKGWSRPHGLFIDVFYRIDGKNLYLKNSDKPFATIAGSFKVFGEKEAKIRPPYLVIGLLAKPYPEASHVEFLRAYAHPCVAWDRLLLVDSELERETLNLLVKCRDWLSRERNVAFTIEKPSFDALPKTEEAHDICKPDFILRNRNKNGKHPTIIVETMGYDKPAYRDRKNRLRALFESIGKGNAPNPVIEHDRFKPNMSKDDVDREFMRAVCKAILAD